jgi:drug/metabolite transporter (DMT)-like permease
LGLLASAFFSATFILNRAMSLSGGHWAWSASLRYGYMLAFLFGWFLLRKGPGKTLEILKLFAEHLLFWLTAGTIGFGIFYSGLCLAADHAPGWVIAATWQSTILATPIVLFFFGRRVPRHGVIFALLIFAGILLVNLQPHLGELSLKHLTYGVIPVFVAAFAYPTGNQLLNIAKHGGQARIPGINSPLLQDAPACVLLMTLGSIPFWIVLLVLCEPPPPEKGQWLNTAVIALSSGVIATSIFYQARNATKRPYLLAAIDATQSGEVVFSLLGEILLLSGIWPSFSGTFGLLLIVGGLTAYVLKDTA